MLNIWFSCSDPESFVRGVQTLTTFFIYLFIYFIFIFFFGGGRGGGGG